jgi:DNA-binding LacI/PurR family transcriptional regulator
MNGRKDGFSEATAKRVLESVQLLNYRASVVGSALRRRLRPQSPGQEAVERRSAAPQ